MSSARGAPLGARAFAGRGLCPRVPRRATTRPRSGHRVALRSDASATDASGSTSEASEVFLACVPLVGLEVLGAALGESYPARLEHALVLVRHPPPPGAAKGKGTTTAYDFLPLDPLSPFTALPLVFGRGVPGEARTRPVRGVFPRRCWRVGVVRDSLASRGSDAVDEAARRFQSEWDTELTLRGNTCVEHVEAMAAFLVGESCSLEAMRGGG